MIPTVGQIALLAAQQGITYYLAKKILMGRIWSTTPGASSNAKYAKPTLQNQLNVLKRQVARNTPSKEYWQNDYTAVAAMGILGTDIPISVDFIANATYRDNINGDRFANHWLRLGITIPNGVDTVRIIVYTAKKTGQVYNAGTSLATFVRALDPAAWNIFHDEIYQPVLDGRQTFSRKVKLRGVNTIYNASSSVLERGDIRVAIITDKSTVSSTVFNLNAQLCYSDK